MFAFRRFLILYFLPFVFLLWDGHIGMMLTQRLPDGLFVVSHALLILIVLLSFEYESSFFVCYLFFLGFIYDAYYYKTIGIVLFLIPMTYYLLSHFMHGIKRTSMIELLVFFLTLIVYESLSFTMGFSYGLTTYPVVNFIIYQLVPTLVFNLLLYLLLKKPLVWLIKSVTEETN